ncbi:methyl-accepting chemotaxis protein [Wenxinia marina]|nr:HAMP domain-containing methyl-accepting chemotaxis protein [Wenxinia marina]GGL69095.1 hypothetical protein GCM10011392_24400 [Wenxinia marina]
MALIAVSILVVALAMAIMASRTARQTAQADLALLARELTGSFATGVGGALRFRKVEDVDAAAARLFERFPHRLAGIVALDIDGAELYRRGAVPEDLSAAAAEAAETSEAVSRDGGLVVALPVRFGESGDVAGTVALLWSDEITHAEIIQKEIFTYIVSISVATLMLGLAAVALRHLLSRPLTDLAGAVDRVAGGDLDRPVGMDGRGDEIGHLARNLDRFRRSLAEGRALEQQSRAAAAEQKSVVDLLGVGLDRLAAGDLRHTLDSPFPATYEALREAYNGTVRTLRDVIRSIVDTTEALRSGADDIAGSTDELSRRTETQAATLEEAAAALEELTASVRSAAENAGEVSQAVDDARGEAGSSLEIVESAVSAMDEIERSSGQISRIIAVIDDIAFQTNLLALNAGVEAARAGDAGRGFAVVASEVRALAQRSSNAAKEIEGLIGQSRDHVNRGVDLVGRTGERLRTIADRVGQIADLVSTIASGTREQATGLGEINVGIGELDRATQQNAAMVVDTTGASHALKSEAAKLSGLVASFRTGDGRTDLGRAA